MARLEDIDQLYWANEILWRLGKATGFIAEGVETVILDPDDVLDEVITRLNKWRGEE